MTAITLQDAVELYIELNDEAPSHLWYQLWSVATDEERDYVYTCMYDDYSGFVLGELERNRGCGVG
jgi:putative sterol carrier protein